MAVIQTKGLTKFYKQTVGIKDLTLAVSEGEIFGYLGPNGAGKTTTMRLLLNLIFPTSGQAKILGYDVVKEGTKVKEAVGYIPGDVYLYEEMTGEELISYLAGLRGQKPVKFKLLAQRFAYDPQIKIRELSHGSRQKLAILLAFAFDPPVYLLDEPTTGLDPLMQREFYRLLKEEKARGKTVFFSSHILSEVEKVCDRAGILKDGKLVAVEDIEALKEKKIRYIEVVLAKPAPAGVFSLPGVEVLPQGPNEYRLVVKGNIAQVLKKLAEQQVEDIIITHASLEEVFLTYYA